MRLSEKNFKKIFMAFGVFFLAAGAVLIIAALGLNARMDNCRRVSATVVNVVESVERRRSTIRHNRHRSTKMYTPIYEYYDGGELKTYQSRTSTSWAADIGSETTLYISDKGKIYERSGSLVILLVGIVFAVVGGVFTLVTVKVLRKKSEENID